MTSGQRGRGTLAVGASGVMSLGWKTGFSVHESASVRLSDSTSTDGPHPPRPMWTLSRGVPVSLVRSMITFFIILHERIVVDVLIEKFYFIYRRRDVTIPHLFE